MLEGAVFLNKFLNFPPDSHKNFQPILPPEKM